MATSLAVDSESRFRNSDSIRDDGIETFGLFVKPNFLDPDNLREQDIIKFIVQPPFVGRPDLIANDIYGNPFLDWIVIHFKPNQPRNPFGWPQNQTVLQLPAPSVVLGNV